MLAPLSRRRRTTSRWPHLAASMRGLSPCCSEEKEEEEEGEVEKEETNKRGKKWSGEQVNEVKKRTVKKGKQND